MDEQSYAMVLWNWGEICAANARIEAMKAENERVRVCNPNDPPTHNASAFEHEAAFISNHALAIRDRAGG